MIFKFCATYKTSACLGILSFCDFSNAQTNLRLNCDITCLILCESTY